MAYSYSLLDLPDLALHKICWHISDPFDLLSLGNTCTRLRKISSAPSLWWSLAFDWCEGLWIHIDKTSEENHPREWLLETLRSFTVKRSTEAKCVFANGEEWKRAESCKFRCLVGMLRLAYKRHKDNHPAVLYEQWLYDIGLYRRVNVVSNFTCQNLEFSTDVIEQLTKLGQAEERDLRRRKQPHKDPWYYIKRVRTAEEDWMSDLFPAGPHGSICPLLMCPLQNAVTNEVSGIEGLSICLCITLSRVLRRKIKALSLPLKEVKFLIKRFCDFFIQDVMAVWPGHEHNSRNRSLKSVVSHIVNEKIFLEDSLQNLFSRYGINLLCIDVLREFSNMLHEDGIDTIVDKMRTQVRQYMFDEINYVLFNNNVNSNVVTRINLTDSDLIGGDNSRQEMSAAAFVSQTGVLVTWHLTGRMRF